MSGFGIIPGGPEDRDAVAAFIGQLYAAHDYNMDWPALQTRADEMLAAGPVFFIEQSDRRIGYAALKDMGDHMYVRHFVIDQEQRGKGMGSSAFKALQAAQFAGRQVRLDAPHETPGPKAFWERQGFAVMGYTMRRNAEAAA
ncbi:MAG: GNAT family N-acetyltransferase [Pseudomonadota bacterium]